MNELKTLIENSGGLDSLDQLLKTIADVLNVSVTQLQNNLPSCLEQIGRYGLVDNILVNFAVTLTIGGLIGILLSVFYNFYCSDKNQRANKKMVFSIRSFTIFNYFYFKYHFSCIAILDVSSNLCAPIFKKGTRNVKIITKTTFG